MIGMVGRQISYWRNELRSEHRDGWYSDPRSPGPASYYIWGGKVPYYLLI